MSKKIKPTVQVYKRDGQLMPVSPYDAEEMEQFQDGQLFDLSSTSKRSDPHHKLYWATLGDVVKATGLWPTSQHLHDDLKMLAGYYRTVVNGISGGVYYVPDSTAYKAMDQREFGQYFEAAMQRLAERIGYDPLEGKA